MMAVTIMFPGEWRISRENSSHSNDIWFLACVNMSCVEFYKIPPLECFMTYTAFEWFPTGRVDTVLMVFQTILPAEFFPTHVTLE